MTKRWAPGACKLLAWEQGVALLDSEISDEQAEKLWTTVQHEAKLATFLQALMEATGAGLLNIPPFAVAILDERGAHVAVRGGWLVSVRTADQDIRLNGENITTWEEKLVAGAVAVELQTSGSHDRNLPLTGGIVDAGRVLWSWGDESPFPPTLTAPVEVAAEVRSPGEQQAETLVDHVPTMIPKDDHSHQDDQPKTPEHEQKPHHNTGEDDHSHQDDQPKTPEHEQKPHHNTGEDDHSHQDDQPKTPEHEQKPHHNTGEDDRSHQDDQPKTPEHEQEPGQDTGDAGVMITVPKRKLPDPGSHQDSRGQTTLVVPVDPDSVVPDSPYAHLWDDSAEVADPGTSGGENIEAKPGEPNAQPSTRTTAGELRDGLTVAANDEIPIASFPSTRGPQVLASFCAAGHPNPPQRVQCYECDAPVSGQPQLVERPQLGWLRITGGETVPLHGPVVAGRNPRSTAFSSPEPPRLIALPHRHISSNHIAFILEGWSVLARDLGSSNGSYLRRHGNPPVRLPENDTLLVPGDVIDLGHGVFINLDRIP